MFAVLHKNSLMVFAFCVLALSGLIAQPGPATAAKKVHPAVARMQIVASKLISAQKIGTRSAFRNVIRTYADLPYIANYSLGRYKSRLKRSMRSRYYRGVNAFMGRYFANESRRYQVVSAQISSDVTMDNNDALVTSRVTLKSGSKYTVVWRLAKRAGTYKITDFKILGFSMSYLQRGMFTAYIKKKQGSVEALITALNRHY